MASIADSDALSITIWGEARGEEVEGRIAVACVLRNRLHTGRWGTDYDAVAHAPAQFSCWSFAGGAANYSAVMRLQQQVQTGVPLDDPIYPECRWIADGILTDRLRDRVQGATHYFEAELLPWPAWAKGKTPICRVGKHLFFVGIA